MPKRVADECGFFTEQGLDYVFEADGFAAGTATVSAAGTAPMPMRSSAFEDMQAALTAVPLADPTRIKLLWALLQGGRRRWATVRRRSIPAPIPGHDHRATTAGQLSEPEPS